MIALSTWLLILAFAVPMIVSPGPGNTVLAASGGLAELADRRLELGLDRLVALGRHAVRLDPLELGLDVCHYSSKVSSADGSCAGSENSKQRCGFCSEVLKSCRT